MTNPDDFDKDFNFWLGILILMLVAFVSYRLGEVGVF